MAVGDAGLARDNNAILLLAFAARRCDYLIGRNQLEAGTRSVVRIQRARYTRGTSGSLRSLLLPTLDKGGLFKSL